MYWMTCTCCMRGIKQAGGRGSCRWWRVKLHKGSPYFPPTLPAASACPKPDNGHAPSRLGSSARIKAAPTHPPTLSAASASKPDNGHAPSRLGSTARTKAVPTLSDKPGSASARRSKNDVPPAPPLPPVNYSSSMSAATLKAALHARSFLGAPKARPEPKPGWFN